LFRNATLHFPASVRKLIHQANDAAVKRVLVTGGSGFLGRHVLDSLIQCGFEVHATSRGALLATDVQTHNVDLFDGSAVSDLLEDVRPSHLVHLAWYTKPPEYWQSPINADWVKLSLNLLEAFVHAGGARFVGAGTCAEYEWGSPILAENATPELPATPYGKAKLSLCHSGKEMAQRAGIGFVWARLFFLFGPHEREERFVPSIVDALLRGRRAHCRNGDLERDFLYVEDAGRAIAALTDSDVYGPVNIASGIGYRLEHIARRIGAAMELQEMVDVDATGVDVAQPACIVANIDRLANEIGWSPRFDLSTAIERTIAWRSANRNVNAA
jgi:nucleoside-diphosphate-sugar epimerase